MPPVDDSMLPTPLVPFAVRAAIEGIPVCAIGRILDQPIDQLYNTLDVQRANGAIVAVPPADWPPTARLADRVPQLRPKQSNADLVFGCHRVFHLTNLEAGFLVVMLTHDRADKMMLHHVVETQRLSRATRPNSMEATDPKMVDVMICKLRKKLSVVNSALKITTVWGGGYYLDKAVKMAIMALLFPTESTESTEGAHNGRPADGRGDNSGDHIAG